MGQEEGPGGGVRGEGSTETAGNELEQTTNTSL